MSDHIIGYSRQIIDDELARCTPLVKGRPIWVIAARSNQQPRVVNFKKVESLPKFMGC